MKFILILMSICMTGCLQILPHISRDERITHSTEVRSFKETVPSHTSYVLKDHTIDALYVSGNLAKESHCKDLHFTEFSDQVVHERDQNYVLLNLLLAGGLAAGSAYTVGHAETLSNERDPLEPDTLSPQENTRALGWIGVGTSVIWAGYASIIGFQAIDADEGSPTSRVAQTRESNHRICTTDPAEGHVALVRDDEVIQNITLDEFGTFRADIGSNPQWCGTEDGTLNVHYQGDLLLSAQFKECAQANLIRKNTADIQQSALKNPAEIFAALEALAQQQEALGDLVNYMDYDSLATEVAESLEKVRQRGIPVIEDFGQRCARTMSDSGASLNCVPKTLEAFAALNLDPGEVFTAMLSARLKHESLGQEDIQDFFDSARVLACALNGECPIWLSQATIKSTIEPRAEAIIKDVRATLTQGESARKKLEKQPSVANLDAIRPPFHTLQEFRPLWCVQPDIMGLQEVCDDITSFIERAEQTAESSMERVREDGIKKTAAAWRANFALCRKLDAGIKEIRRVRGCNSECQAARSKMQADYDALNYFSPENAMWDEATLSKVRAECREASCPSCP